MASAKWARKRKRSRQGVRKMELDARLLSLIAGNELSWEMKINENKLMSQSLLISISWHNFFFLLLWKSELAIVETTEIPPIQPTINVNVRQINHKIATKIVSAVWSFTVIRFSNNPEHCSLARNFQLQTQTQKNKKLKKHKKKI